MATRTNRGVEIANLVDHPSFASVLAAWHVAEWGHLYEHWTLEVAEQEFATMARSSVPLTFAALNEAKELIGSVSLISDDELDGYSHLTPWLASLYVAPHARGRGVAELLIARMLAEAHRLRFEKVYLFTPEHVDYYERRGWQRVARAQAHGHEVDVMSAATASKLVINAS